MLVHKDQVQLKTLNIEFTTHHAIEQYINNKHPDS